MEGGRSELMHHFQTRVLKAVRLGPDELCFCLPKGQIQPFAQKLYISRLHSHLFGKMTKGDVYFLCFD